jgi:hypothetical protein
MKAVFETQIGLVKIKLPIDFYRRIYGMKVTWRAVCTLAPNAVYSSGTQPTLRKALELLDKQLKKELGINGLEMAIQKAVEDD